MTEHDESLQSIDLDFKRHDDNNNVLVSDPSPSPSDLKVPMISPEQESQHQIPEEPLLSQISNLSVDSIRSAIEYISP